MTRKSNIGVKLGSWPICWLLTHVTQNVNWGQYWVLGNGLLPNGGWGLGAFLRWWPPSTLWAGPLIFLWPPPGMSESLRIWGYVLPVEHIWCVFTNCGRHQWTISSLLNSSLALVGGKHYQEITIPVFWLVLQNFAIPGYFPYLLFYRYISLNFRQYCLLLQYVALFQSGK